LEEGAPYWELGVEAPRDPKPFPLEDPNCWALGAPYCELGVEAPRDPEFPLEGAPYWELGAEARLLKELEEEAGAPYWELGVEAPREPNPFPFEGAPY